MKKLGLLLCFLCIGPGANADDWLCKSQAAIKRGNSFYVCGIGSAETEPEARSRALTTAQAEYASLSGAKATQEPGRTDCSADSRGVTCYREVVFTPETSATLERMGKPIQISSVFMSPDSRDLTFHGAMCVSGDYCHIQVRGSQVERASGVNPDYLK